MIKLSEATIKQDAVSNRYIVHFINLTTGTEYTKEYKHRQAAYAAITKFHKRVAENR